MKKVLLFLFAITVISSSFASLGVEITKPGFINASEIMIPIGKTGKQISLWDLSRISRHELEDLTGKRMNFPEKIAFKKTQKTLKKEINPDGTIENKKINKFFSKNAIDDKTKGYNFLWFGFGFFLGLIGILIAGFSLGVILPLIGVGIAYVVIADKEDKKNMLKWAGIGFISLYLFLIVLFVVLIAGWL